MAEEQIIPEKVMRTFERIGKPVIAERLRDEFKYVIDKAGECHIESVLTGITTASDVLSDAYEELRRAVREKKISRDQQLDLETELDEAELRILETIKSKLSQKCSCKWKY